MTPSRYIPKRCSIPEHSFSTASPECTYDVLHRCGSLPRVHAGHVRGRPPRLPGRLPRRGHRLRPHDHLHHQLSHNLRLAPHALRQVPRSLNLQGMFRSCWSLFDGILGLSDPWQVERPTQGQVCIPETTQHSHTASTLVSKPRQGRGEGGRGS